MTGLVSFESNKRRRRTTLTFVFVPSVQRVHVFVVIGDGTKKNEGNEGKREGKEKKTDEEQVLSNFATILVRSRRHI